jgi:putative membrane protein
MFKRLVSPDKLCPMALGSLLAVLSGSQSIAAEISAPVDLFTLCLATLQEARPDGVWSAWSFAPAVIIPLALATVLYARGLVAEGAAPGTQRPTLSRAALFAAGIGCLVIALMSPLCRMATTLAWVHMVQHVLLVAGAPLFFALSRPGSTLFAGLPSAFAPGLLDGPPQPGRSRMRTCSSVSCSTASTSGSGISQPSTRRPS